MKRERLVKKLECEIRNAESALAVPGGYGEAELRDELGRKRALLSSLGSVVFEGAESVGKAWDRVQLEFRFQGPAASGAVREVHRVQAGAVAPVGRAVSSRVEVVRSKRVRDADVRKGAARRKSKAR